MKCYALMLALVFLVPATLVSQANIRPDMVFNLNGVKNKDLYRCFDNDIKTGIDNKGGADDEFMSVPYSSFITLDSISDIMSVRYYVANSNGGRLIIRFYDASKKPVGKTISLISSGYTKQWINIPCFRRSVHLIEVNGYSKADVTAAITEIHIIGKGISKAPSIYPSAVIEKQHDPGIYAHGVNIIGDRIFRKDKDGAIILNKLAKAARFYWEGQVFDHYPATKNNPLIHSPLWLGRYKKDHAKNLLLGFKKLGIKPMMTKTGGSIKWLSEKEASENNKWLGNTVAQNRKYIEPGADPETDTAWKPLAEQYYRLIALYGNNRHADLSGANIKGGSAEKGQNLMEIFEWDNEPSRWWSRDYYHSPKAYYEAINAIYRRGKQADPSALIYAGALPGMDTTYWRALFFIHYLQYGRTPFPADGFNFNAYINDARQGQKAGEFAISPESWGTLEIISGLQAFFKKHFPGKKVQWTEFGFATNNRSPYDVNRIGEKSERQVQADWTLRLKAITQSVKFISRMYYYAFFEDNTEHFGSMGLISDRFKPGPKYQYSIVHPVGYALANELNVEKDFEFYSTLVQNGENNKVWVSRKNHKNNRNRKLYKIWVGSSSDQKISDFSLTVPGAKKATLFQQSYNSYAPVTRQIEVKNGKMVFPVSESMTWLAVEF